MSAWFPIVQVRRNSGIKSIKVLEHISAVGDFSKFICTTKLCRSNELRAPPFWDLSRVTLSMRYIGRKG